MSNKINLILKELEELKTHENLLNQVFTHENKDQFFLLASKLSIAKEKLNKKISRELTSIYVKKYNRK